MHEITSSTLLQIVNFVTESANESKLPVGLITTGSGSVTNASLFKQLGEVISADVNCVFISISTSEASTLKAFLKNVIGKIINECDDFNRETEATTPQKGGQKLLSYDLQKLYNWCKRRDTQKIVIALPDIEAFDVPVLSEFLVLLK